MKTTQVTASMLIKGDTVINYRGQDWTVSSVIDYAPMKRDVSLTNKDGVKIKLILDGYSGPKGLFTVVSTEND